MRRRFLTLLCIGLWLLPAFSLASETPALSLRAEPGYLRLLRGKDTVREWPLDQPAAVDLYWDERYVYAQVTLDEKDAAPMLLCFAYDAAEGWNVEGMERVQWHGAPTSELWDAWGLAEAERSADGLLPALPSILPLENDKMLPCGLHAKDAVPAKEHAMHSALQACGQAYKCDTSHEHMIYDCGIHFGCLGGDPAEHLRYETCDHYLCDGMAHPVLDCGVHSNCDADPLSHEMQPCGHFRCDPACDGTLHVSEEAQADTGGD